MMTPSPFYIARKLAYRSGVLILLSWAAMFTLLIAGHPDYAFFVSVTTLVWTFGILWPIGWTFRKN